MCIAACIERLFLLSCVQYVEILTIFADLFHAKVLIVFWTSMYNFSNALFVCLIFVCLSIYCL